MKGHSWRDRKPRSYPVLVEAKYDEIRCRVVVDTEAGKVSYESYAGKPLHNLTLFDEAFLATSPRISVFEFDVGILVNQNFNDSYRWVRSSRGIPSDLEDVEVNVIMFDLPGVDAPYVQRRIAVALAVETFNDMLGYETAFQPAAETAFTEEAVEAIYDRLRVAGFEGAMVKSPTHRYERKRSAEWLKMKPSETFDGVIMGPLVAGTSINGKPLDRVTSVTVYLEDGSIAQPHGIPHDLGRDMLDHPHKYVGQWVEFDAMERDRKGGYRHPVFRRVREAK